MARKRPFEIKIYVNEIEKKQLKTKIERSKLTQSDYIRKCISQKDIVVIEDLKELTVELKRIGNNLNQLTKAVNQGFVTDISNSLNEEKEQYNKILNKIYEVLKKV